MDCPCCHKSLSDKAKRCPRCGTSLMHSCAICGFDYPVGLQYCPNCNASSYAVQYIPNPKAKKKKSGPSNRVLAAVIVPLLLICFGSALFFAKMNERKAENLKPKPTPTPVPTPVIPAEESEDITPIFYAEPTISWYDVSTPSEIDRGTGFSVRGTVFTDVGVLTDITISIVNSYDNVVEQYSYAPGERSCDLREIFDSQIHFSRLPIGIYNYRILATAVNGSCSVTSLVNYNMFSVNGTGGDSTDPLANSTWYFAFLCWKGQSGHMNADSILNTDNATNQAIFIDGSMFLSGGSGNAVFRGYVQQSGSGYFGRITNGRSQEEVELFEILGTYTDPSDGTVYHDVMHIIWEEFDLFFIRG